MINAGRVGIVPKGEFSATTQYTKLDFLTYNNKAYIGIVDNIPIGTLPTDANYFQLCMDINEYVTKNNAVLENSISRNRISGSAVGTNSIALGSRITTGTDSKPIYRSISSDITTVKMPVFLITASTNSCKLGVPREYVDISVSDKLSQGGFGYGKFVLELQSKSDSTETYTFFNETLNASTQFTLTDFGSPYLVIDVDIDGGHSGSIGWLNGKVPSQNEYYAICSDTTQEKNFLYCTTEYLYYRGGAEATGDTAFAVGRGVKASSYFQTVIGSYNIEDTEHKYAFIIGNGTGEYTRSNALAIKWDGTIVTSDF